MAKAVAKTKVKKKHWVPIYAPKAFNSMLLGESYVTENDQIRTKSITQNLMVLTDDPRKQSYSVRFDVTEVKDGKAFTQVIALSMSPSAIKRLVRRHRDKVDDSFVLKIAGERLIRVKPMLLTRTRSSKAAQTEIRLKARETLRDMYKKMRFEDIVLDIIDGKTQRLLRDICAKTHPIKNAEVREVVVLPATRELTNEMLEQMEKEAAEEEARRQQLSDAAKAAAVEEEVAPAPKKRKPKSIENAEDPGV